MSQPRINKRHRDAIVVLRAVDSAVSPQSAYIANVVDKVQVHRVQVAAGGKGHSPRRGIILARLRLLEEAGFLQCTGGPNGYYGYSWAITPDGRAALLRS
jgi:hypothetical protein